MRLDEQRFPGRQGRILFAYLAVEHGRSVPRDELAELLWGEDLPATWEKALRVLATKLRAPARGVRHRRLEHVRGARSAAISYTLPARYLDRPRRGDDRAGAGRSSTRPRESIDEARDAGLDGGRACSAGVSPGEDGRWVEDQRRDLRDVLVRALECLRDVALAEGEFGNAVRYAAEITALEPFRETSYRALMQAHVAAGDPAEALRVYERCRHFLADELGAYPFAGVQGRLSRDPPQLAGSSPPRSRASHLTLAALSRRRRTTSSRPERSRQGRARHRRRLARRRHVRRLRSESCPNTRSSARVRACRRGDPVPGGLHAPPSESTRFSRSAARSRASGNR